MALFKQMGLICEDSIVHPDMNDVLNQKLGTSQIDYPSNKWADKVAVLGEPLPSKTASGSIAHFTDGAKNVPLDAGIFYFNPVQASGTPTPSDPLPISGHTGLTVTRTGANIWGGLLMAQSFEGATGYSIDTENKTFTFQRSSPARVLFSPTFNSVQYSILISYTSTGNNTCLRFRYKDGTTSDISLPEASTKSTVIVSSTANKELQDIALGYKTANSVTVYYDESGLFEGIITAQDFEAYEGTIYPVSWSEQGTVYGGYYDSVTGELWKTWEYIASYNGETITEPWLSSMDVYVQGTTPTTGAEVCYQLATPVLVAVIDPTKIKTFEGVNNIWNDGGGISEVGYRSKASGGVGTPTFIETVLAEDTNLTGTLDFDGADYNDYDLIRCELYNESSLKETSVLLSPQSITDMFANLNNGICFNEYANNQYAYYKANSSGNWIRGGNRNLWVKKVTGLTGSNCNISVTNIFRLQSGSSSYQTITTTDDLFDYDYIIASCLTGSDGVPCVYVINTGTTLGDMADYFYPNMANAYNAYNPITVSQHEISSYYWFCVDAIKFE